MTTADLDALIAAGTQQLGIAIRPEWQEAIRLHLSISLTHAAAVLDRPIDDACEPAPVFLA